MFDGGGLKYSEKNGSLLHIVSQVFYTEKMIVPEHKIGTVVGSAAKRPFDICDVPMGSRYMKSVIYIPRPPNCVRKCDFRAKMPGLYPCKEIHLTVRRLLKIQTCSTSDFNPPSKYSITVVRGALHSRIDQ